MKSNKKYKCNSCYASKPIHLMVKPSKIGNKPVLCRNCSKKSKNKQTVEYKNGLYYKLGTKLIVKIDPYGVNKRVTS